MSDLDVFILIINIVTPILGVLLFSYIKQKGKNFANKEDIKVLTESVEQIKYQFSKRNEEYKAFLDILKSNKVTLINNERIALLQFHEEVCSFYIGLIGGIEPNLINRENYQEAILEKSTQLNGSIIKINTFLLNIQVSVFNDDIIRIATEIFENCKQTHKNLSRQFRQLISEYDEWDLDEGILNDILQENTNIIEYPIEINLLVEKISKHHISVVNFLNELELIKSLVQTQKDGHIRNFVSSLKSYLPNQFNKSILGE
ncbi:MAG: hypothetical protein IH596_06985 [Bacteroidales bacterium]|nr:hypothetical protein [Bacteroidales bacterium]